MGVVPFFPDDLRSRAGRSIVAAVVALSLLAALIWVAGYVAAGRTRADIAARTNSAAILHAAVLRSELEKYRSLPFVLAEDADVRDAVASRDRARLVDLDRKLEEVQQQTRAAVVYVLDIHGVAIAASNWQRPDSFVGSDYSYRPYFRDALRGAAAEHFALGAVSKRPGLFFARPVMQNGRSIGVVVVKVEFDALEQEWRSSSDPAFVTEAHGVILVTSLPEWRFRTLAPLDPGARARLRASHQFGPAALDPLLLERAGTRTFYEQMDGHSIEYIGADAPAPIAGWSVHVLTRAGPAITATVIIARLAALSLGVLVAVAIWIVARSRARAADRAAAQHRIQQELEANVAERTQALQIANERLIREIEERQRAETRRQALEDELVQANKLAMVGQIAAGVAHEINQPVAAIRSYADNAVMLLDRADAAATRSNLAVIAGLTDRIGIITGELRAFSRKTSGEVAAIALDPTLAGAMLLVEHRAREQSVTIVRQGPDDLHVIAQRVRLEQVLLNLLQNALDALGHGANGRIEVTVTATGSQVRIAIADNGPGLDPVVKQALFTPFLTSKPSGLGLGLVISRDLVTEFGGDLSFQDGAAGALFVITLKKAA